MDETKAYDETNAQREVLSQLECSDIICLQAFSNDLVRHMEGLEKYAGVSNHESTDDGDSIVVWNSKVFSYVGHATLVDSSEWLSSDTVVLLEDKVNKTTICVSSTHIKQGNCMKKFLVSSLRERTLISFLQNLET